MSNPDGKPVVEPVGSDNVEAAVLGHLRAIRASEASCGCEPAPEWMAVDMAWARWSKDIRNEELAALVHWIITEHVKPHNILWAKLREITVRLMREPKAARKPRTKSPNTDLPAATGTGCQPEQAISCAAREGMESRGHHAKPSAAPTGETGIIDAPAGPPGPVGVQSPNHPSPT